MRKQVWVIGVAIVFFFLNAEAADRMTETHAVPVAYYPEKAFQFAAVLEGAEVVHEYIVKNPGTAELLIERVKTG